MPPAPTRHAAGKSRNKTPASRPPNDATAPEDVFTRHGLTRVINVSGTETVKGASPVCPEVVAAVSALVPHSVDMLELQSTACRAIAAAFEAEAGLVVNCTAAGIAMSVAACMTGEDLARVERLPDTTGLRNEVIFQRGHNVNYGGPITQNITLAGGRVVEIGAATECGAYALAAAITPQTAAALYVVSHHTVQSGLIDLETFCRICRAQKIPVIVDAAAEPDPRVFLRAGADLVITSMQKQFASLTAATVAGRLALVRACLFQERGIGRPMKTGKESIIGAIAALARWQTLDRDQRRRELEARLSRALARLTGLPGLVASLEPDSVSRQFSRLHLRVDPAQAGLDAFELADALLAGDPSIYVRSALAGSGVLQFDLRRASDETTEEVVAAVEAMLAAARRRPGKKTIARPTPNAADVALARMKQFPLSPRQPSPRARLPPVQVT